MQKSTDTLNEEQNTHKREQRKQRHPYINTAKASEGKQRMREQEKYITDQSEKGGCKKLCNVDCGILWIWAGYGEIKILAKKWTRKSIGVYFRPSQNVMVTVYKDWSYMVWKITRVYGSVRRVLFPDSSSLPTPEVFYSIHWQTCRNTHHYRNKHHCVVYYCVICLHKRYYTLFCIHFYSTFFLPFTKRLLKVKHSLIM